MKSMNRCAWLLPLVFAASPALANSGHEPECEDVRARIIDAQVTDGCTSPNNFCAGGTVTGNRGLNGTTFFTLDGAVLGPAARPGSFSTSGVLVYTTSRGTLTVRESGLSGLGEWFTAFQEVLSGTGRYEGATGHMWVHGHNLGDHFDSGVFGVLCLR